jgi:hypothetical protein
MDWRSTAAISSSDKSADALIGREDALSDQIA